MTRLALGGKWSWPLRMPRSALPFAAAANSPAGFKRLASATPPSPMPKRLRKPRRESPAAGSGPVQIWEFIDTRYGMRDTRWASVSFHAFVLYFDGLDELVQASAKFVEQAHQFAEQLFFGERFAIFQGLQVVNRFIAGRV